MKTAIVRMGQHVLMALFLLAALTTQHAHADTNAISNINFLPQQNGKLVMKVDFQQNLRATPASFTVNTPPRIAFDLFNTSNGTGKNTLMVNQGLLHSVNVVQAGDRTRIVLNLLQPAHYTMRIDGNSLLVQIDEAGAGSVTNETTHFATGGPGSDKHVIRDVDFRRGNGGS